MNSIMTGFAHRYYIQAVAFVIAVMVMIFSRLIVAARRVTDQLRRVTQFTRLNGLMHYCSSQVLVVVVSEVCALNLLFNFLALLGLSIFSGVFNALLSKIGVTLVVMPSIVIIAGFDFWLLAILSSVFVFSFEGFWVTTSQAGTLISTNLAIVIVSIGSGFVFMEVLNRLDLLTFWTQFHIGSQNKNPSQAWRLLSRQLPISL